MGEPDLVRLGDEYKVAITHEVEQELWEVQPPVLKNWQWLLRSKAKDIPYGGARR